MFRTLWIAALAGTIAFAPVAQACTGIQLTAKDGGVVAARTLEFGIDLHSNVLVIPAGTPSPEREPTAPPASATPRNTAWPAPTAKA